VKIKKNLGAGYSPIYFLASLGSGGIVVTFFMFMMFMVEHEGRPIPVFEDVAVALSSGRLDIVALII